MQKLDIVVIFRDHFSTLRNDETGKLSVADFVLFYGAPAVLGLIYYFKPFKLPTDIVTPLIAIFSIFSALLFSAQIALYSLSPVEPKSVGDTIIDDKRKKQFERQKKFFKEVNFNTSYLICWSCLSLLMFLAFEIFDFGKTFEGAILVIAVSHFFLTLLMLVRRTHIAFSIGHELRS